MVVPAVVVVWRWWHQRLLWWWFQLWLRWAAVVVGWMLRLDNFWSNLNNI